MGIVFHNCDLLVYIFPIADVEGPQTFADQSGSQWTRKEDFAIWKNGEKNMANKK